MDTIEKAFLALFAVLLIPFLTGFIMFMSFGDTVLNPAFIEEQTYENDLYGPMKDAVAGATVKELIRINAIPEETGGHFMSIVAGQIDESWLRSTSGVAIREIYYTMSPQSVFMEAKQVDIDTSQLKKDLKPVIVTEIARIGSSYNMTAEETSRRIDEDFPENARLDDYLGFLNKDVPLKVRVSPDYAFMTSFLSVIGAPNPLLTTSMLFAAGHSLINFGKLLFFIGAVILLTSIGLITNDLKAGMRAIGASLGVAAICAIAASIVLAGPIAKGIMAEKIPEAGGLTQAEIRDTVDGFVGAVFAKATLYGAVNLILALLVLMLSTERFRERISKMLGK